MARASVAITRGLTVIAYAAWRLASCSSRAFGFCLDWLATNLEKGHRSTWNVVVKNSDNQPASVPGKRVEVGSAFDRNRAVLEWMMAMHDMPRAVTTLVVDVPVALPQKRLRFLCIEWQVWIDAGVDVHPVPIDMHRREFVHPAEVLLGNDRDVNWLTLPLSIGDQGGAASICHPPSRSDRMATAMPHHVLVVAFRADELQVARLQSIKRSMIWRLFGPRST